MNSCENCKQFNRVCKGTDSKERYCFFEYGNGEVTFLDDVIKLSFQVIEELVHKWFMIQRWDTKTISLQKYGEDNCHLLSVKVKFEGNFDIVGFIFDRKEE